MFKFVAPALAALCVVGLASTAHASSCSLGAVLSCSLGEGDNSANPEYGVLSASDLSSVSGSSGWFEGWTFVLDNGTNYTGIADNGNVSDIVHMYATGAELWSQTFDAGLGGNGAFGATFAAVLSNALTLTNLQTVQVVGDPLVSGARRFTDASKGEIGLVNENAAGLAHLLDLQGFTAGIGGTSGDTLDIQSTADGSGPVVPEPATLTLVGIGSAVTALRRRKKVAV